jgi:hypothetical protein
MMRPQFAAYCANASRWKGSIWYRMKQVMAMRGPSAWRTADHKACRIRWFVYDRTMKDGPNIVGIAALIGDHARAEVLTALMADPRAHRDGARRYRRRDEADDQRASGEARSTRSRRRRTSGPAPLFPLADRDVAHPLESLMGVAFRTGAVRASQPARAALRKARVCYDHLAGEIGVRSTRDLLSAARWCQAATASCSPRRRALFAELLIDTAASRGRSARSAAPVSTGASAAITSPARLGPRCFARFIDLGGRKRARDSRVVTVTATGEREIGRLFDARAALIGRVPPSAAPATPSFSAHGTSAA